MPGGSLGSPDERGLFGLCIKLKLFPCFAVSLLKRSGNSFHLETNGSEDHGALIMAFLKTTRKIAKIEAVRRKESGRNNETAVGVRIGMHL